MLVLILAVFITASDQITKYMIRLSFGLSESRVMIDGFFNLTYLRNTGAAWGLLSGHNIWLGLLSIVVLILMIVFRRSFLSNVNEHKVAFACLIGGITGNLIDRLRLGYVTDFLDFHVNGHSWPSFNIADAAICIGVGIYILSSFWLTSHPLRENGKEKKEESPEL